MTADSTLGMDARALLRLLRRRAPIVALCALIAGGSAFFFSERMTKQYTATASLLFQTSGVTASLTGITANAGPLTQSQQDTNVQMVGLGGTAAATAKALGPPWTPGGVASVVSISPQSDTNIVNVSATTVSPHSAVHVANTYASTFVLRQQAITSKQISAAEALITRQLAALGQTGLASGQGAALQHELATLQTAAQLNASGVSVAGYATLPSSPSSPKVKRNTALGVVLGLMLGIALVLLLERLDHRLREPRDFEETYGLPVLAAVPRREDYNVIATLSGWSGHDEVFRLLWSYVRYFAVDRSLRTLAVISADAGEGKTTISYNLAKAAATLGPRVLLIEADLRRGTAIEPFHNRPLPALADVLIGDATPQQATRTVELKPNGVLNVLIAGQNAPANVGQLIDSHAMETVIDHARSEYDLVVIDTPPVSVVADAIPLLKQVDGVVVVGRAGVSSRNAAQNLHSKLTTLRIPMLGVVVNCAGSSDGYGYRDSYRYYAEGLAPVMEPQTNGTLDEEVVRLQSRVRRGGDG